MASGWPTYKTEMEYNILRMVQVIMVTSLIINGKAKEFLNEVMALKLLKAIG